MFRWLWVWHIRVQHRGSLLDESLLGIPQPSLGVILSSAKYSTQVIEVASKLGEVSISISPEKVVEGWILLC